MKHPESQNGISANAKAAEQISTKWILLLLLFILGLIAINATLFVDNLKVKQHNKQLILQNDSLFSVSPKIKSTLDTLKKKKLKS